MFIAGAPNLRYGDIVEVIDAAKGAGVEKVGIVTEGMRRAAGARARHAVKAAHGSIGCFTEGHLGGLLFFADPFSLSPARGHTL